MIKLFIIHSLDFRLANLLFILSKNLAGPQVLKFQDPILEFSERPKQSKGHSLWQPPPPEIFPIESFLSPQQDFPSCWALHPWWMQINTDSSTVNNQNAHIMKSLPSLTLLLSKRTRAWPGLRSQKQIYSGTASKRRNESWSKEWSYTKNSPEETARHFQRADQLPKAWWSLLCLV